MIYKVKITRIVGDVSVTYEIETEDKSFAESFIAKDKEESQTESESKSKLEDLVKELTTKDSSDWKPRPFGGIEYWLNQPTSAINGFGK
ncbi:TPA: hypothetical protein MA058_003479 [Klebsiella pneumoniae]|nr:hypothetical protein [Klebsiella pneumoniae]